MKHILLLLLITASTAAIAQNTGIGTLTPTDQLHTTGTVRFEGYRGPGTRLMQLDSSGRMIVTGAGPVFTASPGAAITDNGCATGNGVTSSITVSGQPASVAAVKIAVRINITHTYDGDLRVLLVAPGGAILSLVAGTGSIADDYTNTVFTDGGLISISAAPVSAAPFTGKYKPAAATTAQCLLTPTVTSFGAIGGGSVVPNGTWTLKVFDAIGGDAGTLNDWGISFSGPESFLTAGENNYIPRFNAGNLEASNIYQSTGGNIGIRTVAPLSVLHASDQVDDIITVENTSALSATTNTFLNFKAGNYYTARIGAVGTGTQAASLAFYTSAAATPSLLQKRLSILDGGNVGIGVADASVSEKVHIDGGSMKLGLSTWSSTATDRLLKFGDGNFVSIGEAGADDRMQLTASHFIFKRSSSVTAVGINTTAAPAYTLDVAGNFHTTGPALLDNTVRIGGGSPAAGKVLTATNASGDAVWTAPVKVGFTAYLGTNVPVPSGQVYQLGGWTETLDESNNFNAATGIFIAPQNGLYHFDATFQIKNNSASNSLIAVDLLSNVPGGLLYSDGVERTIQLNTLFTGDLTVSHDFYLTAGMEVFFNITNPTYANSFIIFGTGIVPKYSTFSGYLIH